MTNAFLWYFYLAVAATQNYILEQYHKQDLQFEKAFYDDVRIAITLKMIIASLGFF